MASATITADQTKVFPRFLDLAYPSIVAGQGVWLETAAGDQILDACSGGAMVACIGHGVKEIADAAARQAEQIAYFYNHHFTTRPQEDLADRVIEGVAPEMARVKFASGSDTSGLKQIESSPLISPEWIAFMISTALYPGLGNSSGEIPQTPATCSRAAGSVRLRWPGS